MLGAVLLFFRSGFLGVFLFVFSLLFGLFSVPFWFWVLGAVLLFFRSGFLGVFLFVGAGRRAALFSVGLFGCVLVFFLFYESDSFIFCFFGHFLLFFFSFHFCFDLPQVSNC